MLIWQYLKTGKFYFNMYIYIDNLKRRGQSWVYLNYLATISNTIFLYNNPDHTRNEYIHNQYLGIIEKGDPLHNGYNYYKNTPGLTYTIRLNQIHDFKNVKSKNPNKLI